MVNKASIGGKAEGLFRLQELGLPVPPFVAVPVGGTVDEAAVAALGEPLAVRSSAVGEDAGDRSAAGQYETVLGVTRATLQEALAAQTWPSSSSGRFPPPGRASPSPATRSAAATPS